MNLTQTFPKAWRCDLVVKRSGGRNADGDPVPSSTHTIKDCVVGRRETLNPVDRDESAKTIAVAYGPPAADITNTDMVIVPTGHWMAGTYAVDGDPGFWPLGTEIPLRRQS